MFASGSFSNSANASPDEIARKRAMIAALMPRFGSAKYVGEGLGQLATGVAIGRQNKKLDAAEAQGRAGYSDRLGSAIEAMRGTAQPGGFSILGSMPVTPEQSVADDTMSALGKTPMRPYRDAIASIESAGSGDYSATGPAHPTMGRALGRYQIMEANVAPWSKEVLGREVTPEEFMQNPQLQDAIFDGKFGKYVQQYGPEGAAQAWFAGPGGVGEMGRKDSLGTSVADYTNKFSQALGGPQGAPMAGPQGAAAAVPVEQLYALMTDPWASPEQRAVVQSMIEQQQQLMDPKYQMEMERARLEIDQMKNPQPGFTMLTDEQETQMGLNTAGLYQVDGEGKIYTVQEPKAPSAASRIVTGEEAKSLGLDPALRYNVEEGPNGIKASPIGGGTTVNRTDPAPPPGYRNVYNEQGLLVAQEPIPGSPAAAEAAKAQGTADKRQESAATASDVVTTAANRAIEAANNRAFGTWGQGIVGSMIPQSDAAEVQRQVDVLRSNATIGSLQAMREASPTGGALGSVTESENKMLADKAGALDPSSPNFERDLADYTRTLLRTVHGQEAGDRIFAETWKGKMPEDATSAPKPSDGIAIGAVEDGWEYIGGDPAQPESWRKVQK